LETRKHWAQQGFGPAITARRSDGWGPVPAPSARNGGQDFLIRAILDHLHLRRDDIASSSLTSSSHHAQITTAAGQQAPRVQVRGGSRGGVASEDSVADDAKAGASAASWLTAHLPFVDERLIVFGPQQSAGLRGGQFKLFRSPRSIFSEDFAEGQFLEFGDSAGAAEP